MNVREIVTKKLLLVSPHLEEQSIDLLNHALQYDNAAKTRKHFSRERYKKLLALNAPKQVLESAHKLAFSTSEHELRQAMTDQHCSSMLRRIVEERRGRVAKILDVIVEQLKNAPWIASLHDECLGKEGEIAQALSWSLEEIAIEKTMAVDPELQKYEIGECDDFNRVFHKISDTLHMIFRRKVDQKINQSPKDG